MSIANITVTLCPDLPDVATPRGFLSRATPFSRLIFLWPAAGSEPDVALGDRML